MLVHRLHQTHELLDRLALRAQGDREPGDLGRAGLAAEDLAHRPRRLLRAQVGRAVRAERTSGQLCALRRPVGSIMPSIMPHRVRRRVRGSAGGRHPVPQQADDHVRQLDGVQGIENGGLRTRPGGQPGVLLPADEHQHGGQSKISSLSCRAIPIPPAGTASPSRMARSISPESMKCDHHGSVATSTYSMGGRSGCGPGPSASAPARACGCRRCRRAPSTACGAAGLGHGSILLVEPRPAHRRPPAAAAVPLEPSSLPVLPLRLPHGGPRPLGEQHEEERQPDDVAESPRGSRRRGVGPRPGRGSQGSGARVPLPADKVGWFMIVSPGRRGTAA